MEAPVARARALAAMARGDLVKTRTFFAAAIADAERAGAAAVFGRLRAEARTVEAGPSEVAVARDGELWTVSGCGGVVRIKDGRGVQILARLVGAPHREHHALDLVDSVDAGDAGEVLDGRARDAYRARIVALTQERREAEADNDPGRVARSRSELEALQAELARGVGLGGRVRRAGRASERARVNVQRRARPVGVGAVRRPAELRCGLCDAEKREPPAPIRLRANEQHC